ncbi:hypothetical protein SAMN05421503_0841 [Terribacillus aidingensis]|uniref:Uncharacterized protein n=1 Tax=Terribacillus aidingensis TaxID=586416 RepID=A0A285N814_9BACI|nr:hypothetical protein SAMN05421503_0841 [Terribacillus aidingensis]
MKLVAKYSYSLILILLAISAVTSLVSENAVLKDIVPVSVFVLVGIIILVRRKVAKEKELIFRHHRSIPKSQNTSTKVQESSD